MFWFVITPQDSAVNSHCLEAVCGLTDLCCFDWGVVTGPQLSIQFTDHRSYNPHSKGVYSRDEPLLPIAPHLCSNLTSQFNIQKDPNGNPMLSLNELHRILSKRLPLTDIRVFRIPVTSASRFYFTAWQYSVHYAWKFYRGFCNTKITLQKSCKLRETRPSSKKQAHEK